MTRGRLEQDIPRGSVCLSACDGARQDGMKDAYTTCSWNGHRSPCPSDSGRDRWRCTAGVAGPSAVVLTIPAQRRASTAMCASSGLRAVRLAPLLVLVLGRGARARAGDRGPGGARTPSPTRVALRQRDMGRRR